MATSTDSGPKASDGDAFTPSSLHALAWVAGRLGLEVSVTQLSRRFALEPGEPSTATLIALCKEIGLEARSVRMRFEALPRLSRALPAILRARDGGALILEDARSDPASGAVAIIRDPRSSDEAQLAIDELHLAELWEGEAILVKRVHAATDVDQPFGLSWIAAQVLR